VKSSNSPESIFHAIILPILFFQLGIINSQKIRLRTNNFESGLKDDDGLKDSIVPGCSSFNRAVQFSSIPS